MLFKSVISTKPFRHRGKSLLYVLRHFNAQATTHVPSITTCTQLADILEQNKWYEKYRVLDATWDLHNRDYKANHFQGRIGGSKFFSFEECRDLTDHVPRMLPTISQFSDYVTDLGIANHHHVVVYDNHEKQGLYSSPRVWWMFRVFGHDNVSVLEGGLQKWLLEGYPLRSGDYYADEILPAPDKRFKASKRLWLVKDFETMKSNALSDDPIQVMDARGRGRYLGLTESGEEDPKYGHIPKSHSVPFTGMLNEDRTLKTNDEIVTYLETNGIDLSKDVISTCGSGITACILAVGAHHACKKDVAVYDGSWTEWFERGNDMIERGEE